MSFKFKDLEIRKMKLADLKPAEYNPRKITDRAFSGLTRSMEQFGNMVPIVWNKRSGNIVGGHQRYRTLVEAGEKETDVVVADLDDNEEMALNIVLNSKELRGGFTSEVVQQLKLCEARFGDMFDAVGLKDLLNELGTVKFDDKPTATRKDKNSTTGGNKEDNDNDKEYSGPEAIITCPKCKSYWKMKNNEVVFNAVKAGGEGNV